MIFLRIKGNKFFKKHKYYTFKKSEHEVIYIKKLEDNKIFYNNYIYDENFFFYHKLNALFDHLNQYREEWLKEKFNRYYLTFLHRNRNKDLILRVIDFKLDRNGECHGLTEEQYNWVVAAYSYNIPYDKPDYFKGSIVYHHGELLKDLIPNWLYINGWLAIKPVYDVFGIAKYKLYRDRDRVYKDPNFKFMFPTVKLQHHFIPAKLDEDGDIIPVEKASRYYDDPILQDRSYFEEILDADEDMIDMPYEPYEPLLNIANGQPFEVQFRRDWLFEDDFFNGWLEKFDRYENNDNNTFYMDLDAQTSKLEDVYDPIFNPLNEGSRVRVEWLEYDENKKYDEFDLNCKTNTYYMRYKFYNEVAWKDYPEEKKCSTEVITYNFTETEIKASFENMTSKTKTGKEKLDFILNNPKICDALFDYIDKLDFLDMKYCRYFSHFKGSRYKDGWYLMRKRDYRGLEVETNYDVILQTYEKLGYDKIYQFLHDPRYILIMPLFDAFFEVFRKKGWFECDKSFTHIPLSHIYLRVEMHNMLRVKKYFELTLEYQEYYATTENWASQDFHDEALEEDCEDVDDTHALDSVADNYHNVLIYFSCGFIMYYFFLYFILYHGYWAPFIEEISMNNVISEFDSNMVDKFYMADRPRSDSFRLERKGPRNFLPNGKKLRRNFYRVHHPWAWKWRWRKFRPTAGHIGKLPMHYPSYVPFHFYNFKGKPNIYVYPIDYIWQLAAFIERDEAALKVVAHEIAMFGRKTAISIYNVDGTLRVRWYTKLYKEFLPKSFDILGTTISNYFEEKKNKFMEKMGITSYTFEDAKSVQFEIAIAVILIVIIVIILIFAFGGFLVMNYFDDDL